MSIASEIQRLSGVRGDIFNSITNKGVTVPVGSTFSSCPSLIDQIQGGGGGPATSMINSGFTASGYTSGYRPFTATQIPVANPTYVENSAYSGATFQNQGSYFAIFGLKQHLCVMANYYDVYQVPSYLILTMSASASNPQSVFNSLYSDFMSDNFFNNSRIFLVGNNQFTYITTASYTTQKYGYKEFSPNDIHTPSAVYLSAIADLSPIVNDPNLFDQATPSSTIYGDGFSLSFERCNQLRYQFPDWIRQFGGSIVSSISACASVTTAYPYPSYPSTTTGYITNDITGREFFVRNGLLDFTKYEAIIGHSGYKNIVYDNSPEGGSESFAMDEYSITAFSSNMLKNNITAKTNYNVASTAYTYNYGTTQTAYSGFEGT
jgi:hypothetical protein